MYCCHTPSALQHSVNVTLYAQGSPDRIRVACFVGTLALCGGLPVFLIICLCTPPPPVAGDRPVPPDWRAEAGVHSLQTLSHGSRSPAQAGPRRVRARTVFSMRTLVVVSSALQKEPLRLEVVTSRVQCVSVPPCPSTALPSSLTPVQCVAGGRPQILRFKCLLKTVKELSTVAEGFTKRLIPWTRTWGSRD